jgi:hypothetical protein
MVKAALGGRDTRRNNAQVKPLALAWMMATGALSRGTRNDKHGQVVVRADAEMPWR